MTNRLVNGDLVGSQSCSQSAINVKIWLSDEQLTLVRRWSNEPSRDAQVKSLVLDVATWTHGRGRTADTAFTTPQQMVLIFPY